MSNLNLPKTDLFDFDYNENKDIIEKTNIDDQIIDLNNIPFEESPLFKIFQQKINEL